MKRVLIAATAAMIAVSGAASAMTSDTVSGLDAAKIRQYAPAVDLSLVDPAAVKKAVDEIYEHRDDSFAMIQTIVRNTLSKAQ